MAEFDQYVAVNNYDYDEHSKETVNDELIEVVDSQLPKRKLLKISRIEKIVYLTITLVAVIFAFAIIYSITTVQTINNKNAITKAENDKIKESIDELQQKVSELLRADRVKKIAKKKGLSDNSSNSAKEEQKD
ncbi:MAG: cell division protein FtsL [Lactobacillales bacterium]|jgi:cell division protein FtsL|nr:cell division protein FtsL [Lactobacillales bacterium]